MNRLGKFLIGLSLGTLAQRKSLQPKKASFRLQPTDFPLPSKVIHPNLIYGKYTKAYAETCPLSMAINRTMKGKKLHRNSTYTFRNALVYQSRIYLMYESMVTGPYERVTVARIPFRHSKFTKWFIDSYDRNIPVALFMPFFFFKLKIHEEI